jgi:hypothetical protein
MARRLNGDWLAGLLPALGWLLVIVFAYGVLSSAHC